MIIFIDMDDVVADPQQRFIEWYKRDYGKEIALADYTGKTFIDAVPKAHVDDVKTYAFREGFFRDLPVKPHCQEVIEELTKKHEIFFMSAATEFRNSYVDKHDWLDKHFPFISWKNRIFCGSKKIALGDVLIDDFAYNLETFQGRRILFTAIHNLNETRFERANDWLEVKRMLS